MRCPPTSNLTPRAAPPRSRSVSDHCTVGEATSLATTHTTVGDGPPKLPSPPVDPQPTSSGAADTGDPGLVSSSGEGISDWQVANRKGKGKKPIKQAQRPCNVPTVSTAPASQDKRRVRLTRKERRQERRRGGKAPQPKQVTTTKPASGMPRFSARSGPQSVAGTSRLPSDQSPAQAATTTQPLAGTSDHCLVKSVTSFSPPDCDSRGERRMWRYKLADWDEMRHFFASYPWQQVCFSSKDPSSCAEAVSDVVRQAMEYYIPYSDVPIGGSARPWFNADCAEAEKNKHSAFLTWVDARDRKAPDLSSKKRAFNHAAKSYKKALRKARFDRITHIGKKLSAQPAGSRAFWSLAKSVEANFCRPTLPSLVRPDGTLAHTAREKAGLFASLFARNSRLDTSSATPPTLPHCDTSMSEVRIRNKEVLRALCRLDVNKANGPDGMHSNINAVHHHLETDKPHLLFLTETQIRCPSDAAYLNYPGYSLEHHFRQRAGVCVYVRNDICCQRLRHLEDPDFSTLWLLVDTGMDKIVYACVYRSHSGDQETTRLFDHLSMAADTALHRHPDAQFVALGDFNACHQDWLFPYQRTDHAGREARNFAVSMGLSQLVKQATRVPDIAGHTANCLDLLLTTDPDRCIVTVSSPLGTSDHCLVKSVTSFSPPDCDSRGERRVWRYKSADWDEMRHFFASYPWQRVCFSSENPSSCEEAISDVVRQAMEYFIPYSDVPVGSSARPWFNADCAEAEKRKHSAFLCWVDARDRKAPDLSSKKRAFNHAAKSYKKALRKARFDCISHIGQKLSAQPSGSRAFWSLAKSVEANFCRPTLPPLVRPDGALAHTAREKAGLFASLFAHNSRLDTGSATPPTLPHCGTSMPEFHIRNKEVLRALCRLDVNKANGPDGSKK
ncbi:hypothetical protein PYW07_013529 [Mythimna separata]|uniref:Endonuclease/exonuclease/phosphatase domain-containing protein n=1 Tax=Mythimna separata TaxID=271217 RepID=A0AAD8DML3_MYTSE|nr:hypothetical protein PYW07_013529 [Mythimna separata]